MNMRDLVEEGNARRGAVGMHGDAPATVDLEESEMDLIAARAAFLESGPSRHRAKRAETPSGNERIDLLAEARRYGESGLGDAELKLIEKRRATTALKPFREEIGAVAPFVKRTGVTLRPDDKGLTRFSDSSTADTFAVDYEVTPRPGYPRVDNAYSKLYFASATYDAGWVLASKGAIASVAVNIDFQHYLMGAAGNDDSGESDNFDDWAFVGVAYSLAIFDWSDETGVTRIAGTLPQVATSSIFYGTTFKEHVSNAQPRAQDPRVLYPAPQWKMIPDINLFVDENYWGSSILVSKGGGLYVRVSLLLYAQTYGDSAGAMFRTSMRRSDGSTLSGGRAMLNPAQVYLTAP
jgi:hypothetical protein